MLRESFVEVLHCDPWLVVIHPAIPNSYSGIKAVFHLKKTTKGETAERDNLPPLVLYLTAGSHKRIGSCENMGCAWWLPHIKQPV